MKIYFCAKCRQEKADIEFYFYPNKNRRSSCYCKGCLRKISAERQRGRNKYADRKVKLDRYRLKYPEKLRARALVGIAKKKGLLKQLPCIKCNDPNSQAHHHDYSKPLEIEWLCLKCHTQEHYYAS